FQSMSYTIDVYRGVVAPLPWRRSFDFVTYVALFPQLVAGPIVRFRDLADQLRDRVHALDRFGTGVFIFMLGFAKKILIANRVGPMADALFAAPDASFIDAWAGMTSYAIQIYFDFSGYSDMAIGLGMMFGFVFPRNFDGPYRAESITEFWRRWHISLSTWLRDYLYLPLGGNRNGAWRTYRNLGLTMILGGLWHGAAWTFILWGAWHGLLLAAERMAGKRSFLDRAPRGLRVAFTFVLVILGWVLFRAPDLEAARSVYAGLFGAHGLGDFGLCGPYSARLPLMTLAMGLGVAFFGRTTERLSLRPSNWTLGLACMVFAVALLELLQSRFNPFLYYQF
ncbi:MAG: MBOAT family protein, partial [Planctomycetes bacterium]|nr:MBOAT family protein [Planctomycetota bacterium]